MMLLAGPFQQISQPSPDDVAGLVYELVSGPADQERDWDRYRSLYTEDARLIFVDGSGTLYRLSVEDYIRDYGPHFDRRGIVESEIHSHSDRFADLVQRWSTYQYRWLDDESDQGRGLASFQLVVEGGRWKIASLIWHLESDEHPIPPEFLPPEQE